MARNRCPGGDTGVACHGWTMHCGAGDPRFVFRGEPQFLNPHSFRWEGAWELGLIRGIRFHLDTCLNILGWQPFWWSHLVMSYYTSRFGTLIQRDLCKLLLLMFYDALCTKFNLSGKKLIEVWTMLPYDIMLKDIDLQIFIKSRPK